MKKFKYDIILIFLLLVAGITLLSIWLVNKNNNVGHHAYVKRDDVQILVIDMSVDATYEIEGVKTKMVIEVKNGYVSVINSGCPDQICVHHTSIKNIDEKIVCLPNKVIIRVGE